MSVALQEKDYIAPEQLSIESYITSLFRETPSNYIPDNTKEKVISLQELLSYIISRQGFMESGAHGFRTETRLIPIKSMIYYHNDKSALVIKAREYLQDTAHPNADYMISTFYYDEENRGEPVSSTYFLYPNMLIEANCNQPLGIVIDPTIIHNLIRAVGIKEGLIQQN